MSIYCITNKYEVNHVQYNIPGKYGWELNPLTFELKFVKMMLYHLVLMVWCIVRECDLMWCDVIYNNNYINVVDGRASNAPCGIVEHIYNVILEIHLWRLQLRFVSQPWSSRIYSLYWPGMVHLINISNIHVLAFIDL